ncbi:MAG TPA: saccharopine dehydrogenase NADP-binding domain-containing protein [Jatrophihabitantaceae bacterium]|nr:saccharopine dehydrogenase NADP-binding domain-containing protein [Jatrophihabitantaceae bacterium]
MPADRTYDIVLFGATGFTGGLTADYLAHHAPAGLRWALAGRNQAKLEAVRRRLAAIEPALAELALLSADVTDADSLRHVAESARVVISTVGPYVLYGEPLVAACASAGTDYLDLTGEPEFVDTMYLKYHITAVASGARLIHCCGFDSIPHDLGVYFTVGQLPEGVPLRVEGFVRSNASFSGGTFHSAITGFSRARKNVAAARQRRKSEPRPGGRSARAVAGRLHREPVVDAWAVPLPTVDGQIVGRSARALARYGPDFRYSHYAAVKRLTTVLGATAALAATMGAAQVPPLRKVLLARINPGDGPTAARRARSWFTVTFIGEGGGRRVVTRVSGGDPGYDETSKMLAETALSLALDANPLTSGQVTTAQAAGDSLLDRLMKAGLTFEVLTS